LPDGELEFRRPNGAVIPEVPPVPDLPADPVAVIRAGNEANGLALHAQTALPGWLGERLDLVYAIDVLHPRARERSRLTEANTPDPGLAFHGYDEEAAIAFQ
jgi:hypothetical protein